MMKPKTNRAASRNTPNDYDRCQTPHNAIDPLLPYLRPEWLIWESAAGEGQIVDKLNLHGYDTIGTDILTDNNFFSWQPERWDCQITNPPYSVKYDWLRRSYELGKPFALLLPVEALGAYSGQKLFQQFGVEIILLNRRVNFKMPFKGYAGNGAQFSAAWFTWRLNIGATLTYASLVQYGDGQLPLLAETSCKVEYPMSGA